LRRAYQKRADEENLLKNKSPKSPETLGS
jgi:hypothetical protein